jgi:ABC-type nitrate/sulfonate/bicarbonate transport system substrate-binding protein
MDKIHFPYRSSSHLAFLHVVAESGSWERHDLDVEYDAYISSEDAHKHVADGSVEFVGGNHVSTYAARTRGDQWLYLGQTVSLLDHRLVVRADSGIEGVSDLKEKVVAIRGNHPGLNTWLFLKQHGLDEDRGDVKLERIRGAKTWEAVRDGNADAALVNPPADLFAERAGLKVIAADPLPMVWFTTMSSGRKFVDRNPDIVERFLKGTCQGIAYFKTHRQESIKIIQERYNHEGELDLEAATRLWESISKILSPKPYASFEAVGNVYELAKRQNPAAAQVEPMALWDYHYLRKIDDSGFIDGLYQT